jgi:hypothetical protein
MTSVRVAGGKTVDSARRDPKTTRPASTSSSALHWAGVNRWSDIAPPFVVDRVLVDTVGRISWIEEDRRPADNTRDQTNYRALHRHDGGRLTQL